MPKLFVSVALLIVLLVATILGLGVWAGHPTPRPARPQAGDPRVPQTPTERRAKLLGWIQSLDKWIKDHPDFPAEAQQQQANALRQELGLPLRDYSSEPAREPAPPVKTDVAKAALTLCPPTGS